MTKFIIANYGSGNKGKSTSVKEVYKLLAARYPTDVTVIHPLSSGDVKAIIKVKGILVGIESQGDPNSRMKNSLVDFLNAGCKIIVAACRSYGDTANAIEDMHKYGYQVIWATNDKNWDDQAIIDYLNIQYARHVIQIIEDRIAGIV